MYNENERNKVRNMTHVLMEGKVHTKIGENDFDKLGSDTLKVATLCLVNK